MALSRQQHRLRISSADGTEETGTQEESERHGIEKSTEAREGDKNGARMQDKQAISKTIVRLDVVLTRS